MDLIHKNVQVAGAGSSRRRVFAVLGLLEILVLVALIGACGTSAGEGNAPSESGMTSSGAPGSAGAGDAQSESGMTSSGASGSAGAGNASSQSGMTSSGAPIGGDQVLPPSATAAPFGDQPPSVSGPASPSTAPSSSSPSPCPTPESPGQACPKTTPPTPVPPTPVPPTPVPPTPVPPTPAPASGLARVFSYPDSPTG
jgi:hypothetical protein